MSWTWSLTRPSCSIINLDLHTNQSVTIHFQKEPSEHYQYTTNGTPLKEYKGLLRILVKILNFSLSQCATVYSYLINYAIKIPTTYCGTSSDI